MKTYKNNAGFSIILAILMTGFMLVLTMGVFMLVLSENQDTKNIEYYFKASEGAEGGIELAMLQAKKYNYSYDEKIDTTNPISKVLFQDPTKYNKNKDVILTYDLVATGTGVIDKKLASGEFDIFPLFSYNNGVYKKVNDISITGLNNDIVWNIVGNARGISGVGNFTNATTGNLKTLGPSGNIAFEEKSIPDFLNGSENNYLIIHNVSSSDITYSLQSLIPGEYLTKDISTIIASGEVGEYKQNLQNTIKSSQYLNLLKYSIFSSN